MPSIGPFTFTAPTLFWIGVVGAVLPVLAHLLYRKARQRVVFPSVRLLATAAASQSGLFKLRRLLLLIARVNIVLLLAAAFTRPLWSTDDTDPIDAQSGAKVVIVFDNSASSAMRVDGVQVIESLRAEAERLLDGLESGRDRVNVVFAEARPRTMFPQMSLNPQAARDELRNVEPTHERADLSAAIAEAGRMLIGFRQPRRIVVITDAQASNWSALTQPGALEAIMPAGHSIGLTLLPVDDGQADNLAVTQPRFDPPQPIVGQPFSSRVRVTNHDDATRTATVTQSINGQPGPGQSVTLDPRQSRELRFEAAVRRGGIHEAVFTLTPRDTFDADNTVYAVFESAVRVPVIVISDDDPDRVGSDSYYLMRALAPLGEGLDDLAPRHAHPAALDAAALRGAGIVMVANASQLSPTAARALVEHVNRGAGLVWWSDDGPTAANFVALDNVAAALREGESFMPATPITLQQRDDDEPLRITAGAWGSKLLSDFDAAGRNALAQVAVRRAWSFAEPRQGTGTLLAFDDGSPAFTTRPFGAGRVVVGAFGVGRPFTDLTRRATFVALVQTLARYVRPAAVDRDEPKVGRPHTWMLDAAALRAAQQDDADPNIRVIGPGGDALDPQVIALDGLVSVTLARPLLPGHYRVTHQDKTLAVAGVNLDARESDTQRADLRQLAKSAGRTRLTVRDAGDLDPLDDQRGTDTWPWWVVAAALFMAIELVILVVWKR